MSVVIPSDNLTSTLSRPILPLWAETSSFDTVLREIEVADSDADARLRNFSSEAELRAYCEKLREKMRKGLGDFPEKKCPLNPKTVDTVFRDGYRVEKLYFESHRGVHVTANLFLPDSERFKPPYRAVIQPCGHCTPSKGAPSYQRLCVLAAKKGLAVLIFDTINTGERQQGQYGIELSWEGHNHIGALADILGQSFGGYRVWDAVRALDYLDTRDDICHDGYGCFGNSGGGNITAFLTALDGRVKASAPNGYITTFRAAARDASIGPGDAEQNIFGQLTAGVNHLAFCLMRFPVPVLIGSTSGDQVFPYCGTAETYANLRKIAGRFGYEKNYSHIFGDGLHGYRESTRRAAVDWMCKWLIGESDWTDDTEFYRKSDDGFDISAVDAGLSDGAEWVTPTGDARTLPNHRTYYDFLRDEMKNILEKRGAPKTDPETVRKTAGIRRGSDTGFILYDKFETESEDGYTAERGTFKFINGLVLPSLLITGENTSGEPLITVGNGNRSDYASEVKSAAESGRPVLSLDLIGCGEISKKRRGYYGMTEPEEEMSVLLRALGRTLVGEQAEEIIIAAEYMKNRFGKPVGILAFGRTCVAAAHARAAEPELISSVTKINPPSPWTAAIEKNLRIPFAVTVPGALKFYDWTDL